LHGGRGWRMPTTSTSSRSTSFEQDKRQGVERWSLPLHAAPWCGEHYPGEEEEPIVLACPLTAEPPRSSSSAMNQSVLVHVSEVRTCETSVEWDYLTIRQFPLGGGRLTPSRAGRGAESVGSMARHRGSCQHGWPSRVGPRATVLSVAEVAIGLRDHSGGPLLLLCPRSRWHRPAPPKRVHRRHGQRLGRTPRRLSVDCTQTDMQEVHSNDLCGISIRGGTANQIAAKSIRRSRSRLPHGH
jgi:hypothetical protein